MQKITEISPEHFHDVTISILEKYNLNNECSASNLEILSTHYCELYLKVYNSLIAKYESK